ncbi:MAG TPA: GrpB family protein [Candidatus Angelobacter sp.]|nr:GrpB family protein [Candidatus Angelobacter sp.]
MANPVIILDYDSNWPALFQSLRKRIADALGDMAAAIEHVGSTAVPDLAAKPIIDIDVLLTSEPVLRTAIERLARLRYVHRGNLGIPEREAFFAPVNDPPHHVYVCPPDSAEFRRHVAFRDYLRAHPMDAKIYGELKVALAERFRKDRPAYNNAKSEFVEELTSRAIAAQKKRPAEPTLLSP